MTDNMKMIDGLSELADSYDAFILDLFGVVHDGITLYPGTLNCLKMLKESGKRVVLLSNTPKRGFQSASDIKEMGVDSDLYTAIVTAGDSTYKDLHARQGKRCWFVGAEKFEALLHDLDIHTIDDFMSADFILNAIPGTSELSKTDILTQLDNAVSANIPMVCANPDLVVNIGDKQYECAGTYALHYEQQGGQVTYHGKPHAPVYDMAFSVFGDIEKNRVLAVGDSLHTDIQGANNYGIDSVFNLVGIHWEEAQLNHAPGKADIDKVRQIVASSVHKPNAVMTGLKWDNE